MPSPSPSSQRARGLVLKLVHAGQDFRAEQLDRVQRLLASDRAEAQVEDAGTQLVANPLDLREHALGSASQELPLLDPLVERAHLQTCLLGLGISAVVAGAGGGLVERSIAEG